MNDEKSNTQQSLEAIRVELSKSKLSIESFRAQANQWNKEKVALEDDLNAKKKELEGSQQEMVRIE